MDLAITARCIFCLEIDQTKFNTIEHILPESLGGGDWALLPSGLLCDRCQNKFGSAIEQQALAMYPFSTYRIFFGIPTKKRKAPWLSSHEGKIIAGRFPGLLEYEPNDYFKQATIDGTKSAMILLAVTPKPDMLLRTLLKMGLETIACKSREAVFEERFDAARRYALTGVKEHPWFYVQYEDHAKLNAYLKNITPNEWFENFFLEVNKFKSGLITFHLRLLYLDLIVPLLDEVIPPDNMGLNEPYERLIIV